ncbi:HNH endonuclease signature motif containing protein [Empedobacter falsenii]
MECKNKIWTEELENKLIELYPNNLTQDIADAFQMKLSTIQNAAHRLGLKKDKIWISETARKRTLDPNHGGRKYQFKKGGVPINKGLKQKDFMSEESIQKSIKTRFKKGQVPLNKKPLGSERITKDGYIEIKVFENNYPKSNYVLKHRLEWEKYNPKIKRNEIIIFKDGDKTNCSIENLTIMLKSDNMRRNAIHNYPTELKETIRLKNKLIKKIKSKS